eukprot:CFRG1857T1
MDGEENESAHTETIEVVAEEDQNVNSCCNDEQGESKKVIEVLDGAINTTHTEGNLTKVASGLVARIDVREEVLVSDEDQSYVQSNSTLEDEGDVCLVVDEAKSRHAREKVVLECFSSSVQENKYVDKCNGRDEEDEILNGDLFLQSKQETIERTIESNGTKSCEVANDVKTTGMTTSDSDAILSSVFALDNAMTESSAVRSNCSTSTATGDQTQILHLDEKCIVQDIKGQSKENVSIAANSEQCDTSMVRCGMEIDCESNVAQSIGSEEDMDETTAGNIELLGGADYTVTMGLADSTGGVYRNDLLCTYSTGNVLAPELTSNGKELSSSTYLFVSSSEAGVCFADGCRLYVMDISGTTLMAAIDFECTPTQATWTADGSILLVGDCEHTLHFVDLETKRFLFSQRVEKGNCNDTNVPPYKGYSFKRIFFASSPSSTSDKDADESLFLLCVDGRLERFYNLDIPAIRDAILDNDLGRANELKIQIRNHTAEGRREHEGVEIMDAVAINGDDSTIFPCNKTNRNRLFMAGSGLSKWAIKNDEITLEDVALVRREDIIVQLELSHDQMYLIARHANEYLSLWDTETLVTLYRWHVPGIRAFSVLTSTSPLEGTPGSFSSKPNVKVGILRDMCSVSIDHNETSSTTHMHCKDKISNPGCYLEIVVLPDFTQLFGICIPSDSNATIALTKEPMATILYAYREPIITSRSIDVDSDACVGEANQSNKAAMSVRICIRSLTETIPQTMLYHLLSKHKFEEAVQYATLYRLDLGLVRSTQAAFLLNLLNNTDDGQDGIFIQLAGCLDQLDDLHAVVDLCLASEINSYHVTQQLIEYAVDRLQRSYVQLHDAMEKDGGDGFVESKNAARICRHLRATVLRTKDRFDTYTMAIAVDDPVLSVWRKSFRCEPLADQICLALRMGKTAVAFLIWRRHLVGEHLAECLPSVLNVIPENISQTLLTDWLRLDVIPYISDYKIRTQLAGWVNERASALYSKDFENWPSNAYDLLHTMVSCSRDLMSDISAQCVDMVAVGAMEGTSSFVAKDRDSNDEEDLEVVWCDLRSLYSTAKLLVRLAKDFDMKLSPEEFWSTTALSQMCSLLDKMQADEILPDYIKKKGAAFATLRSLDLNTALHGYIMHLISLSEEMVHSGFNTYGLAESRVLAVYSCITRTHEREETMRELMRVVPIPCTTRMQAEFKTALERRYDVAKAYQEFQLRSLAFSYGVSSFNVADERLAKALMRYVCSRTEIDTSFYDALAIARAYNNLTEADVYVMRMHYLAKAGMHTKYTSLLSKVENELFIIVGQTSLTQLLTCVETLESDLSTIDAYVANSSSSIENSEDHPNELRVLQAARRDALNEREDLLRTRLARIQLAITLLEKYIENDIDVDVHSGSGFESTVAELLRTLENISQLQKEFKLVVSMSAYSNVKHRQVLLCSEVGNWMANTYTQANECSVQAIPVTNSPSSDMDVPHDIHTSTRPPASKLQQQSQNSHHIGRLYRLSELLDLGRCEALGILISLSTKHGNYERVSTFLQSLNTTNPRRRRYHTQVDMHERKYMYTPVHAPRAPTKIEHGDTEVGFNPELVAEVVASARRLERHVDNHRTSIVPLRSRVMRTQTQNANNISFGTDQKANKSLFFSRRGQDHTLASSTMANDSMEALSLPVNWSPMNEVHMTVAHKLDSNEDDKEYDRSSVAISLLRWAAEKAGPSAMCDALEQFKCSDIGYAIRTGKISLYSGMSSWTTGLTQNVPSKHSFEYAQSVDGKEKLNRCLSIPLIKVDCKSKTHHCSDEEALQDDISTNLVTLRERTCVFNPHAAITRNYNEEHMHELCRDFVDIALASDEDGQWLTTGQQRYEHKRIAGNDLKVVLSRGGPSSPPPPKAQPRVLSPPPHALTSTIHKNNNNDITPQSAVFVPESDNHSILYASRATSNTEDRDVYGMKKEPVVKSDVELTAVNSITNTINQEKNATNMGQNMETGTLMGILLQPKGVKRSVTMRKMLDTNLHIRSDAQDDTNVRKKRCVTWSRDVVFNTEYGVEAGRGRHRSRKPRIKRFSEITMELVKTLQNSGRQLLSLRVALLLAIAAEEQFIGTTFFTANRNIGTKPLTSSPTSTATTTLTSRKRNHRAAIAKTFMPDHSLMDLFPSLYSESLDIVLRRPVLDLGICLPYVIAFGKNSYFSVFRAVIKDAKQQGQYERMQALAVIGMNAAVAWRQPSFLLDYNTMLVNSTWHVRCQSAGVQIDSSRLSEPGDYKECVMTELLVKTNMNLSMVLAYCRWLGISAQNLFRLYLKLAILNRCLNPNDSNNRNGTRRRGKYIANDCLSDPSFVRTIESVLQRIDRTDDLAISVFEEILSHCSPYDYEAIQFVIQLVSRLQSKPSTQQNRANRGFSKLLSRCGVLLKLLFMYQRATDARLSDIECKAYHDQVELIQSLPNSSLGNTGKQQLLRYLQEMREIHGTTRLPFHQLLRQKDVIIVLRNDVCAPTTTNKLAHGQNTTDATICNMTGHIHVSENSDVSVQARMQAVLPLVKMLDIDRRHFVMAVIDGYMTATNQAPLKPLNNLMQRFSPLDMSKNSDVQDSTNQNVTHQHITYDVVSALVSCLPDVETRVLVLQLIADRFASGEERMNILAEAVALSNQWLARSASSSTTTTTETQNFTSSTTGEMDENSMKSLRDELVEQLRLQQTIVQLQAKNLYHPDLVKKGFKVVDLISYLYNTHSVAMLENGSLDLHATVNEIATRYEVDVKRIRQYIVQRWLLSCDKKTSDQINTHSNVYGYSTTTSGGVDGGGSSLGGSNGDEVDPKDSNVLDIRVRERCDKHNGCEHTLPPAWITENLHDHDKSGLQKRTCDCDDAQVSELNSVKRLVYLCMHEGGCEDSVMFLADYVFNPSNEDKSGDSRFKAMRVLLGLVKSETLEEISGMDNGELRQYCVNLILQRRLEELGVFQSMRALNDRSNVKRLVHGLLRSPGGVTKGIQLAADLCRVYKFTDVDIWELLLELMIKANMINYIRNMITREWGPDRPYITSTQTEHIVCGAGDYLHKLWEVAVITPLSSADSIRESPRDLLSRLTQFRPFFKLNMSRLMTSFLSQCGKTPEFTMAYLPLVAELLVLCVRSDWYSELLTVVTATDYCCNIVAELEKLESFSSGKAQVQEALIEHILKEKLFQNAEKAGILGLVAEAVVQCDDIGGLLEYLLQNGNADDALQLVVVHHSLHETTRMGSVENETCFEEKEVCSTPSGIAKVEDGASLLKAYAEAFNISLLLPDFYE